MHRKIAVAVVTLASFAGLAGQAAADPSVTVCGSAQVTINGTDYVNNATCQVLPPQ